MSRSRIRVKLEASSMHKKYRGWEQLNSELWNREIDYPEYRIHHFKYEILVG